MACYANLEEINAALSSTTFAALNTDFEENLVTLNTTKNFIYYSTEKLLGEVWDREREHFTSFCNILELRQEVEKIIENTNKECLEMIKAYLEPDTELDTAQLPELKLTVKNIEQEIENLQKMMLETVTVYEYDYKGNVISSHEEPSYDNATLQALINELQPILEETNRLIEKIEGLEVVMKEVEKKQNAALQKINKFEKEVKGASNFATFIDALVIGTSGIAKVLENVNDGAVWVVSNGIASIMELFGNEEDARLLQLTAADFISIDYVGNINSKFYNETSFGKFIDTMSSIDDDKRKDYQDKVTNGATWTLEMFLGATVSPYASSAIGALSDIGKTAEITYQNIENPTIKDNALNIGLNGISGGIRGYFSGEVGRQTTSAIANAGSIKNFGKSIFEEGKTLFNNFKMEPKTTMATMGKNTASRFLSGWTDKENIIEFGLGSVANVLENEELSVGKVGFDTISEAFDESVSHSIGGPVGDIFNTLNDLRQSLER